MLLVTINSVVIYYVWIRVVFAVLFYICCLISLLFDVQGVF